MIARILEFSLRQRAFVLLATALLVGVGLWSASQLPIDAVPDITNVQVQINTEVPALAPEETERLVTFPLETELTGVPGMDEVRSLTRFGLSQITLIFKDGTDIYRARQLVSERLQNALEKIPTGLAPKLAPITTGLSEIYQYVVDYAPDATNKPATRREQLMELNLIQDFTIKPMLRTVPGVAEINAMGGYEKQIVVLPNPEKLRDANLTFAELAKLIGENVENAGGGVVNRGSEQLIVRSVGRVETTDEIASLPIKFGAGVKPLLVKDVAEVGIGSKVRTGAATENGEEAIVGMAMMLTGENSRIIAKRVAERIQEIQVKLPPGVVMRTIYDRSELVDRTVGTVEKNLFEGAVLVVVVLLALLGNWRAALIVACAIPLSFLFAMTGMVQGKISGNLMSLGAIDFGLIIDGAVVIVENIVRQLAAKQHQLGRQLTVEERLHTVLHASKEVGNPMFFGVLIITIVYVPILALSGVEGKMFHPMALAVMLCLGGALLLTLTLMPVLCSFVLGGRIHEGDNLAMRVAKKIYRPMLEWSLRRRWVVTSGAVILLVLSIFVFNRLGAVFVPKLDEGSLLAMVFRTNSINLDASLELQQKTEKVLLANVPEISRVFSRIGTSEVATDPMPPSQTDFYIFYKPQKQWRKIDGHAMSKDELAKTIVEEIEKNVPGQEILMSQPIEMRFNELLEGVRSDIAVKIFGDDYDVLEKIAGEVKELLEKIPGADEVEFEASGRVPMLEAQVNRAALEKYNLPASEVNNAISTAVGGQTVGTLIEGNRRYDIVVRMPEELRQKIDQIHELPVRVGENGLLPLSKVADFKITASVDPIKRDSGQRRAAILVNLRGRDVESFVHEAERQIKEKVEIPEGYTIEFGGQFKNLQEARARLAVLVPATLALIFVLVFMAFGSLRQSIVIYTGVPLAATGGVFALWICGMPFSISAGVGFIALSGVAVLDGLVMISCFNQLREQGKNVREAVMEGSLTRLRPILMTALVASFGFVPMAIATGAGAEVQRPLAIVVIGGLLTSTFLKLVLLPVLYEWVEKK
ncbi:MAG TPA: CusA/CzcA family heavy metal efflux RND transporter [Verrucomicrobia subdivision 3 bacterium]|nr:CusA/CzcA family heavy metal efflux RND transporter [Limisphaerales bacterium]